MQPSRIRSTARFRALLLSLLAAAPCVATAQSVVINKYVRQLGNRPSFVELLVTDDAVDMRSMILKDYAAEGTLDNGLGATFSNNALWNLMPSGTIIVLRGSGATFDTDKFDDGIVDVSLSDPTYFTSVPPTFDIEAQDMVQLKVAGSGAIGSTGAIHTLATMVAPSAIYTASPGAKLLAVGSNAAGQGTFVVNADSLRSDFTDATGAATAGATGLHSRVPNNATNGNYITFLRGCEALFPSGVSASGFTANWRAVPTAVSYRIDVGIGTDYSSPLPGFLNADAGTGTSLSIPTTGNPVLIYRVRAVNAEGQTAPHRNDVSPQIFVTADSIAPNVVAAFSAIDRAISLNFDDNLGPGALDPAKYAVSGPGLGGLTAQPDRVTAAGPTSVRLHWDDGEKLLHGSTVTVTATNVPDHFGNVQTATQSAATGTSASRPRIQAADAIDERNVEVRFDSRLGVTGTAPASYVVTGIDGIGSLTTNPDSVTHVQGGVYRLNWNAPKEMLNGAAGQVAAPAVADTGGNPLNVPTFIGFEQLATPPELVGFWQSYPASPNNAAAPLTFDLTWTEPVTGVLLFNYRILGTGDFGDTFPTSITPVGDGSTWRMSFTVPPGEGTIAPLMTNNPGVTDLAGNPFGAFEMEGSPVIIDRTAPTANFALLDPAVTSLDEVRFEVTFSETLAAAPTVGDVTVVTTLPTGASVTAIAGAGPTYTIAVARTNPAETGELFIQLGASLTDRALNPYGGGTSPAYTLVGGSAVKGWTRYE